MAMFKKFDENINGQILDIGCLMGGAGFIMSKINLKGNHLSI